MCLIYIVMNYLLILSYKQVTNWKNTKLELILFIIDIMLARKIIIFEQTDSWHDFYNERTLMIA